MSKKLINERAILLFPSLAKEIGLNNSIFLQQLHFWCDIADELGYGKLHDGHRWVYKTAHEWQSKDFPFWSVVTIRRIINSLHSSGLIHCMHLDDDKWNRTLFYRINYLHKSISVDQTDNMQVIKLITSKSPNREDASYQTDKMLSEITTKNTTESTTDINNIDVFWKLTFNKADRTKLEGKRERAIRARLKEGYSADEIKTAIRNVSKSQWHIDNGQTDIELICRNQINLDKYLALKPFTQQGNYQQQQNTRMQEIQQLSQEWELNNESNYQPY